MKTLWKCFKAVFWAALITIGIAAMVVAGYLLGIILTGLSIFVVSIMLIYLLSLIFKGKK